MTDGRGWGEALENEPSNAEPDQTARADVPGAAHPKEKPRPAEWSTCEDAEGGAGK